MPWNFVKLVTEFTASDSFFPAIKWRSISYFKPNVMISTNTLLLQRKQVQSLLQIKECIDAVEEAFKLRAIGKAAAPGILGIHAKDGGFHIKAGVLDLGSEYFVRRLMRIFL